jgi:uncharacterized membrane protein
VPPEEGPRYDSPLPSYGRPETIQNQPTARREPDLDRPAYDRPEPDEDVDAAPRIGPAGQADLSGTPHLDIGQTMGAAQRVWGEFLGPAIGFTALAYGLGMAVGLGSAIIQVSIPDPLLRFVVAQAMNFFTGVFIVGPMWAGFPYAAVRALRRERWQFADCFSGYSQYGHIVVVGFVMQLLHLLFFIPLVAAAAVLILSLNQGLGPPAFQNALPLKLGPEVLPVVLGAALLTTLVAIYVFIRFSLAGLLILDQRMSATEALATSWKITNGKALSLIGLGFLLALVFLLGALACGVGLLFAFPYVILCQAAAYLCLTGQLTRGGMPVPRRALDDYARRDHGRDDYSGRRDLPPTTEPPAR